MIQPRQKETSRAVLTELMFKVSVWQQGSYASATRERVLHISIRSPMAPHFTESGCLCSASALGTRRTWATLTSRVAERGSSILEFGIAAVEQFASRLYI